MQNLKRIAEAEYSLLTTDTQFSDSHASKTHATTTRPAEIHPTEIHPLEIARLYTRDSPSLGDAREGTYLVAEFGGLAEHLPQPYRSQPEECTNYLMRSRNADGTEISRVTRQARNNLTPIKQDLRVTLKLQGALLTHNGTQIAQHAFTIDARPEHLLREHLDEFTAGVFVSSPANILRYHLRQPANDAKKPLVVFLHGSGQRGSDGFSHLVSSRGAVGVLDHEDCWVLAPQLSTVFDPFDTRSPTQTIGGGIYWQTRNRREKVINLVKTLLNEHPSIDRNRVYIHGLSRGGEGALAVASDAPELFAAAASCSGREIGCVEYIDGDSTTNLALPLASMPIWLFHTKQDGH